MAYSSLLPMRRASISFFPRAISKYHFPFISTLGISNGQLSFPASSVFLSGLP
jgi:hypothetical protein